MRNVAVLLGVMTPEEALQQSNLALREAIVSLHEDLLEIKTQISDLRETIRTKWWIPVAVTLIGTAGTVIATAILTHK
jgi:hypothetical protein